MAPGAFVTLNYADIPVVVTANLKTFEKRDHRWTRVGETNAVTRTHGHVLARDLPKLPLPQRSGIGRVRAVVGRTV